MSMRKRKLTKGKVAGAKFTIKEEKEENDLKKVKGQTLKELEEKNKDDKDWYDQEMDKNLKK